jgi:hypothetical protein
MRRREILASLLIAPVGFVGYRNGMFPDALRAEPGSVPAQGERRVHRAGARQLSVYVLLSGA